MTSIVPLGDQAALAYFATEAEALAFAAAVRGSSRAWLVDVVGAYSGVAIFFDLQKINFTQVAEQLTGLECAMSLATGIPDPCVHNIPCCYERQRDLARVTQYTGLRKEEVIRLHTNTEFTVYAIGFCPGFPYLGYLPPELRGVPRLPSPRLGVEAGSVGLTGRQTGIYTEMRPGGWNIIGRTPLELVNVRDGYFPIRTGDRVRFASITEAEFEKLKGGRL